MDQAEEEEYLQLLEQEDAASYLISFTLKTWKNYKVNWHHEVLARKLEEFAYQKNKRLMVFMGPRHGKSELVSRRFPAWRLGLDPDREIVLSSYSAELANGFNQEAQSIMASSEYLDIFPDTRIPESGDFEMKIRGQRYTRNSKKCQIIGHRGSLYSVGVDGSFTGMGADDLIIDDPHKDIKEAYSKTARDRVWNWWRGTASTRLEKDANVLLCQTRWHKDDLAGRLLAEMREEEADVYPWDVIQFPSILTSDPFPGDPRAEGEALWPWKFDLDNLRKKKRTLGSTYWAAIHQQNPVIDGGNIIKEHWFRTYDVLPKVGEWGMSWDLSFGSKKKKASYVVGQVWLKSGPNYFIVDQVRDKLEFTEGCNAIERLIEKYPQCRIVLIEKKANGAATLNTLQSRYSRLKPVDPGGDDKEQRLLACASLFECGNVWLPRQASWKKDYVEELTTFPASVNDDQVDTTTQMLNYWWDGGVSSIIAPTSISRQTPWR